MHCNPIFSSVFLYSVHLLKTKIVKEAHLNEETLQNNMIVTTSTQEY